jgi:hypothetical protein
MFLLGISDEGNGRAIVSYGNPDTAKNVATYVPGLGTSLDEDFAVSDLKRARDTAIATREIDSSSATIAWLGYDAPQFPDGLDSLAVMGAERAEAGGRSFSGFVGGLAAANENEDPHLTAIGHSYGSRTVGAATQEGGGISEVDDIVLVGSPGVGVDHAEDLGVGREHVFVGAAENDMVTKAPSRLQGNLGAFAGPVGFGVGSLLDRENLWFGRDPASEAFGATRFRSDEGPPLIGPQGFSFAAHSRYFDRDVADPVSADSIALIAAGKAQNVKVEEPR